MGRRNPEWMHMVNTRAKPLSDCSAKPCPFCGKSHISCLCCYEVMDFPLTEDGLTPDQYDRWLLVLSQEV